MTTGAQNMKPGHFIFLLPLLLATGCAAVGPTYVRPAVAVPPAYKEAARATGPWQPAQPQEQASRGAWWTVYGDPQLNALASQVEVNNQNIKVLEAQYRQAQAEVQGTRAGLWPTVNGSLSSDRSGSAKGSAASQALSLDASWEPDLWGRVRRSVEAGTANAQASAADLAAARLSAQATLVEDYLQLRINDALHDLYTHSLADYQQSLRITQNQYRAGMVSRADVAQAETQLQSTQAQLTDLGVQRAQLEHAMAVLIGRPPAGFSIARAKLSVTLPVIPAGMPSTLLQRRPDIAAAERRVAAANANIGVAQAARYPSLNLTASGGLQAGTLAELISTPLHAWALGAALAQSLFDGGQRQAQVRAATAAYDATVSQYRQTVLNGFQEVEDNLAAQRILAQETGQQQAAVKSAREAERISMNQYRAGIVSYLNVVTAQATALANERSSIQLLGRQLLASTQLVKALGGGWR